MLMHSIVCRLISAGVCVQVCSTRTWWLAFLRRRYRMSAVWRCLLPGWRRWSNRASGCRWRVELERSPSSLISSTEMLEPRSQMSTEPSAQTWSSRFVHICCSFGLLIKQFCVCSSLNIITCIILSAAVGSSPQFERGRPPEALLHLGELHLSSAEPGPDEEAVREAEQCAGHGPGAQSHHRTGIRCTQLHG